MDLKDLEDCNKFIKRIKSKIRKKDNNLIKRFIEESEEQITISLENIGSKFYKIKENMKVILTLKKVKLNKLN